MVFFLLTTFLPTPARLDEGTEAPGAALAKALPGRVEILGPFVRYDDAAAAIAENRLGYPLVFRDVVEAASQQDAYTRHFATFRRYLERRTTRDPSRESQA